MAKFTKCVEVDAVQWDGSPGSQAEIVTWAVNTRTPGSYPLPVSGWFTDDGYVLEIATLEGVLTAKPGDWIIRGEHGEFWPCKPDVFAATYEAVEPYTAPAFGQPGWDRHDHHG